MVSLFRVLCRKLCSLCKLNRFICVLNLARVPDEWEATHLANLMKSSS